MKRLNALFRLIGNRPTIAIQFILGVVSIAYGIFVITLFIPSFTAPAMVQFFLTDWVRQISGAIAIIPGIFSIAECFGVRFSKKAPPGPRISNIGNYGLFLAYMYYVLTRFLTGTAWIWTWLFPLGLGLIAGVLVLSAKWRDDEVE